MVKQKTTNEKERSTSKVLGILSIVVAFLAPLIGCVLAIGGLSVRKSKEHYNRDVALNVIGLIGSIIMWIIYFIFAVASVLSSFSHSFSHF